MRRLILALAGIGILFIVVGVVAAVLVVSGGGLSEAEKRYEDGVAALQAGRHDEAIELFGEAIDLDSEFAKAYVARAQAYWGTGKFEYGLDDTDEAIDLDPEDSNVLADAYVTRAQLQLPLERPDAAVKDADEAIELNPGDLNILARAHAWRSFGLLDQEELEDALDAANEAIELEASDDNVQAIGYIARSLVYLAQEESEKALDDADAAISLEPQDVNIRAVAHIAKSFALGDRHEEALVEDEAAIQLDPPNPRILRNAYAAKATDLEGLGRLEEAKAAADKACGLGLEEACGFTTAPTREEALDLLPRMVLQLEDLPPGFKTYDSRFDTLEDEAGVAEDAELFQRQLESWGFILGHDKFYAADTPSEFPEIYVEIWLLEDVQGAEEAFIDGGLYLEAPGVTMLDEFPVFGDESEAYRLAGPYPTLTGEEIQVEGHMVIIRIGPFLAVLQTAFLPGQALDDAAIDLATKLESRMESQVR
jgi:tetratricopeptide (TPR) repeat protein